MFKDKNRFTKFLKIAMPILFALNIALIITKFIFYFVMDGSYEFKLFAVTMMYSGGDYYSLYSFTGLVLTGNMAISILAFIALTIMNNDNKFRVLTLCGAICSLVVLVALLVCANVIKPEYAGWWCIPVWIVVAAYHLFFAITYFVKMLQYRKEANAENEQKEKAS